MMGPLRMSTIQQHTFFLLMSLQGSTSIKKQQENLQQHVFLAHATVDCMLFTCVFNKRAVHLHLEATHEVNAVTCWTLLTSAIMRTFSKHGTQWQRPHQKKTSVPTWSTVLLQQLNGAEVPGRPQAECTAGAAGCLLNRLFHAGRLDGSRLLLRAKVCFRYDFVEACSLCNSCQPET